MQQFSPGERIAITGMALCNALGLSIEQIWPRTLGMASGIVRLTPQSLPGVASFPGLFAAPFTLGQNSYADVLGLCPRNFTRQDLRVPPQDLRVMSASTQLTLHTGHAAVARAGLDRAGYDARRVGVFTSQNAAECASTLHPLLAFAHAEALARAAATHGHWDSATEQAFVQRLRTELMQPDEGSMLNRLNCTAAGKLCEIHGFAGPSFSVGAACASSMAALFAALPLLRDGTLDAALVGGGEEVFNPLFLIEFCAMGALARPQPGLERPEDLSRPFDRRRSGFVLGEGAAMLVLERESCARRRGARIYGLITGAGGVTNNRSPIEPDATVQRQAIELSLRGLDHGPDAVELVECHATATVRGDREEALALAGVYGTGQGGKGAVLSAYKGQVGHSMGSSGLMALIHGLLAMRDHIFPGTLNCTDPDPDIPLAAAGLRVPHAPEPWDNPREGIRRMQVNAFAFGGACYAVQVEEDNPRNSTRMPPQAEAAYEGTQDVVDGVRLVTLAHHGEEWRLGSTTPAWKQELAGLPQEPTSGELAARARRGVWLHKAQEPPPVALMCCGQGSIWPGMGRALYDSFAPARAAMDNVASIADWDILSLLDEPDMERITLTRWQQPYLFLLEYAQASYLQSLGFTPNVMSGHSLGELIALCLAGVYSLGYAWHVINTRAIQMAELETTANRDTGMLAVYAGEDVIAETLKRHPDLLVSNYNTPTQFILSGPTASLQEARRVLRKQKFPAVMLNVSLAFHNPAMRVMRESAARQLGAIPLQPARLPMMSCVTTGLYPETPAEIVEYICDLDENPVRWVGCVQAMWEKYGVRHFVELGPTDTLCSLTTDIKPEALCLSANKKGHEVESMRTLVARLYALGHLPRRVAGIRTPPQTEDPRPTPPRQAVPPQPVPPHIEELMPILMSVTGYQRHELTPDMDLTQDLAIRSSRFPQIIHEAEARFGVSIGFEDLLGVATIRDLAEVLRRAREDTGNAASDAATATTETGERPAPPPLRRFVPEFLPLPTPTGRAQCDALPVLLVTLAGSDGATDNLLAQQWRQCLQALGATIHPCDDLPAAMGKLETLDKVQGLVVCLPPAEGASGDPANELAQALALLQGLLGRNPQALCVVTQYSAHAPVADSLHGSPLAAGLGGMFLALALEYPKALLRVVVATGGGDANAEPACPAWLPQALIRPPATPPGEVGEADGATATCATRLCLWHVDADGALLTPGLKARACVAGRRGLPWRAGDVVLVSGGGRGITPVALRELAAMGCRLALLGRSQTAPGDVLRDLADHGAPAVRHFSCDVTDSAAVEHCLAAVQAEFGRVDGLIHAAGLIHDATLAACDLEKAARVITTKCRGLHNLLQACTPLGLRWAVAFSSLAGWLGNYGQSAYSAANRAMAALLQRECAVRGIACRCLWLPPVAGAGMAQDVREQLHLRGLDGTWLELDELGGLLCRTCAGTAATHALWARKLPHVPFAADAPTADAKAERGMVEAACQPGKIVENTAGNDPGNVLTYPLSLDYGPPTTLVAGLDISHYTDTLLTPLAARVFGQSCTPEATDPGTAMLNPSAPWATPGLYVAALAHAAEVYAPWTTLLGLRRVYFTAPLPCPPGVTHQCRIHLEDTGLRLERTPLGHVACHVVQARLRTPALAANGRRTAQEWELCRAELLLAAQPHTSPLVGVEGGCAASRELVLPVAFIQESIAVLEKKRYTAFRYWCDMLLAALRSQAARETAATECVWWSALDALWVLAQPSFTEAAASFAPIPGECGAAHGVQPCATQARYDACLCPATDRATSSLLISGASLCIAPPPLQGDAHRLDTVRPKDTPCCNP